jgi:hypothetical protein
VAVVRKRTIPTERPPLVSKYQPLRIEGAALSARQFPTAVNLDFLNPEPSSSNYPQEAEWTLFQTNSEKNLVNPGIGPRYLDM